MSEAETRAAEIESPGRRPMFRVLQSGGLLARIGNSLLPTKTDPQDINLSPAQPAARRWPSAYMLSFFLIVVIPAIGVTAYFALVASDQYVSETRFAVKSAAGADSFSSEKSKSTSLTSSFAAASDDAYLIATYVRSRACVDEVLKTLNLREIYGRPEADFWARLDSKASPERLEIYWRRMVEAYVDPASGIVTVTVSAFRRDDAIAIASAVLKASEKVANDVSSHARDDIMKLAQAEVDRSQDRVASSLADLQAFRQKAGYIDPKSQAEMTGRLLEELIGQRIKLQTELSVSSLAMSPEAPTLQALRARLNELDAQIAEEKSKVTSQFAGSGALADQLPKYEELLVHSQFAEKVLDMASEGLERARLRAIAQSIYINVFVPPALPQEALYPERFASSVVTSIALLIVWGICALTGALIEDHKL